MQNYRDSCYNVTFYANIVEASNAYADEYGMEI